MDKSELLRPKGAYLAGLLILSSGVLLLSGPPGALAQPQPVLLEFDFVPGFKPDLEDASGTTVKNILLGAQIELSILFDSPTTAPQIDCVAERDLQHWMATIKDEKADWYIHGLMVPDCCQSDSLRRCGIQGALWFQDPKNRVREDFLIFHERFTDPGDRTLRVAHEMAHILNTHHCELGLGDDMKFPDKTKIHLVDHRRESNEGHVRPGAGNQTWCDGQPLIGKHQALHDELCNAANPDRRCCRSGQCSEWTTLLVQEKPAPGVKLTVAPELPVYVLGEPFRVNVVLERDEMATGDIPFLTESSLDPRFGYVRIWFRERDSGDAFQAMNTMMFAESDFEPQMLVENRSVEREGYDIWFSVPLPSKRELDEGFEVKDLEVKATYAGFVTDRDGTMLVSNMVAVSDSAVIQLRAPKPGFERLEYEKFIQKEARLFLLLMGGDHLKNGKTAMEDIADNQSVYTDYAKFALGASMAMPFHSFHSQPGQPPPRGAIRTRPPIPDKAREYLGREDDDQALPNLPPSYKASLKRLHAHLRAVAPPIP